MSIKTVSAGILVGMISLSTPALADADFQNATTVAAIKKAGGQQISGASILKIVTNRTVSNPDWTWSFKDDGTQSSKARDNSWTSEGVWDVRGNQLCRTSDGGDERCSNVYYLGRDLKFSEAGSKTKVSDWYVRY